MSGFSFLFTFNFLKWRFFCAVDKDDFFFLENWNWWGFYGSVWDSDFSHVGDDIKALGESHSRIFGRGKYPIAIALESLRNQKKLWENRENLEKFE